MCFSKCFSSSKNPTKDPKLLKLYNQVAYSKLRYGFQCKTFDKTTRKKIEGVWGLVIKWSWILIGDYKAIKSNIDIDVEYKEIGIIEKGFWRSK